MVCVWRVMFDARSYSFRDLFAVARITIRKLSDMTDDAVKVLPLLLLLLLLLMLLLLLLLLLMLLLLLTLCLRA